MGIILEIGAFICLALTLIKGIIFVLALIRYALAFVYGYCLVVAYRIHPTQERYDRIQTILANEGRTKDDLYLVTIN